MYLLIVLLLSLTALLAMSFSKAYSFWRTGRRSPGAVFAAVTALASLLAIGYLTVMLVYTFVYIPHQGKVIDVMPDTSWIEDERDVLYLKEGGLYAASLNGRTNKRLYDGEVRYYALSPDRTKMAVYSRGRKRSEEDRNTANIVIVDLADGAANPVESRVDCGTPSWFPMGSKIYYKFGRGYHIKFYDTISKVKESIDEPKMVADVVAARSGDRLFYSTLFDKKCYEVDVNTKARKTISPYRSTQGSTLFDCVEKGATYEGIRSGNGISEWKRESPDKKRIAYNESGSLWLKSENGNERLIVYEGVYDSKLAPGVWPISWSDDGKYLVSGFEGKLYISDIERKKTGYLTEGRDARILGAPL